ncbi:MAG: hypothetical protein QGH40_01955 [bacterium]|jgi:hypothetical protein|nr:hypothetical protein [bacterium]
MRSYSPVLLIVCLTAILVSTAAPAGTQNLPDQLGKLMDPEKLEKLQEQLRQELEQGQQPSGKKSGGIDLTYWVSSFFFGLLGTAFFIYGKKQSDYKFLLTGLILMIYPYFVHSGIWIVVIGIGILGLLVLAARFI